MRQLKVLRGQLGYPILQAIIEVFEISQVCCVILNGLKQDLDVLCQLYVVILKLSAPL
jgi:hypothetical protein